MNATDTEFYRAFAGRVRDHLPTSRSTTPEGSPDMNTTIETSAAPTVPAAFQPAPDAPCERHPWCTERGEHLDCYGPEIGLDADGGSIPVLVGQLHYDGDDNTLCLLYQRCDDWKRHTSADLRAEADLVRAHAARLDALADQYDAITEAASQETPAGSVWTVTTTNGIKVAGHLPPFAEADPSESGVAPDWLSNTLDDICHQRHYDGQSVEVDIADREGRDVGMRSILVPQIEVSPFAKDPAKRVPTAVVELVLGGDDWIGPLDPQGVSEVAGQFRAQAAVLDQVAADLAAARADWARNGGTR